MMWFGARGAAVFMPVFHSRDYDLIADWGEGIARVQVKTSTVIENNRWRVAVCTMGGNQSWNGVVKRLDPATYDYLFVLVEDGRRWFIPAREVCGGRCIYLGGPRYAEFEVEPDPIGLRAAAEAPTFLESERRRGTQAVNGDRL